MQRPPTRDEELKLLIPFILVVMSRVGHLNMGIQSLSHYTGCTQHISLRHTNIETCTQVPTHLVSQPSWMECTGYE